MRSGRRKADEVADDLLRRIVQGELAVGSVLPREADLAERYGVNRSVVREANKLLEVHQLVSPTRRRGTEVLDPLCSVTPAVLSAMLVDRRGRIDPAMLGEFLEIRAMLDVQMAGLAAERRDADDLAAIESAVVAIESEEPGTHEAFEAANEFGAAVARASKNRIFVMLSHWHAEIAGAIEPLLSKVRAPAAARGGYRMMLEAIRARDAELAKELLTQYHRWASQQLLEDVEHARDRRKPAHRG